MFLNLDKEVVILIVVQLLDHLIDQEHIFEGKHQVMVLMTIEVGQYLVHDDFSLAVEDTLILLLLVSPLLSQRFALEEVLILRVV